MMQIKLLMKSLSHFVQDIKAIQKHQWKEMNIFDSDQMMYFKCHKVNFRRGGSYIDSPDWIKKKKATIDPKDKDDKCFQYAKQFH